MSRDTSDGPRRRSFIKDDVDTVAQLDAKIDSPRMQADRFHGKGQRTIASLALGLALCIGAALVLLQGLGVSLSHLPSFQQDQREAAPVPPLAIQLHPDRHALRPPQNITLDWMVSAGFRSPDGVKKRVYLVNDIFPGPTIEARTGDNLIINVYNGLRDEGVAIHWHGLRVPNAMDGAVGFTQCPIKPGGNFTYRFNVGEQHGTFWWHAHFQSQRGDGLYGGLVVHAPRTSDSALGRKYEQDALLMIGDHFHRPSEQVLTWYTDPGNFGNEPVPDSILINGRGRYNCAMAVPARPVECTQLSESLFGPVFGERKTTRLRLINVGSIAGFSLSIDDASIKAIAVDASSNVQAVPARSLGTIYPGERVDTIIEWLDSGAVGARMRINLDDENFNFPNPALEASQSFPVGDHPPSIKKSPSRQLTESFDLATATARPGTVTMPPAAQHTILLYVKTQKLSRYSNAPRGFINHTSWTPQSPPLAGLSRSHWNKDQLAPFVPLAAEPAWVDLIINNLDDGAHPFHLHSHAFYVLSTYRDDTGGWGSWDPYSGQPPPGGVQSEAPLLKDTVAVPRRGHVLLRFRADQAGMWMLHCHMLVHLGSGMAVGIHVGPEGDEGHVLGVDERALGLCNST